MVRDVVDQCVGRGAEIAPIRRLAQRPLARIGQPARELGARFRNAACGFADAILQQGQFGSCGDAVGRRPASAAQRRGRGGNLCFNSRSQRLQQGESPLRRGAHDPGTGDRFTRRQALVRQQCAFACDHRGGTLRTQFAFLLAHKGLHDTDFAHRHEVAIEVKCIARVDGQIVDTDDELRVRQLSGRRNCAFGGRDRRFAGRDIRRPRFGQFDGIEQRQRHIVGHRRERSDDGDDEAKQEWAALARIAHRHERWN